MTSLASSELFKFPQVVVEKILDIPPGPIIDAIALLVALFAVACCIIVALAMWSPKALPQCTSDSHGHRLRQPGVTWQKRKSRAKKTKKVIGMPPAKVRTSIEATTEMQVSSEEELEIGQMHETMPTLEPPINDASTLIACASTQPSPSKISKCEKLCAEASQEFGPKIKHSSCEQTEPALNQFFGPVDLDCETPIDHEMPIDHRCSVVTNDQNEDAIEADHQSIVREWWNIGDPYKENHVQEECGMCGHGSWGCAEHRTYSIALLLLHRDKAIVLAEGPPGLETFGEPVGTKILGVRSIEQLSV